MKTVVSCLFFMFSFSALAEVTPEHKLVTPLSDYEVFEGQLFHLNMLWVGQRASATPNHELEIYNADTTAKLKTISLKHNVNQMYAYGKNKVLVLGLALEEQYYSYYSVIEYRKGRFSVRSHRLHPRYQFDYAAIDGNTFYFTDIGRRRVYSLVDGRSSSIRLIAENISNPGPLVVQDGSLWILERRGGGSGDESLTKVNLKTKRVSRVSGKYGRLGLERIVALPKNHLIAMTEEAGQLISFVNTLTGKYVAEVQVNATIYDIQKYRNCVVAVDGINKKLTVVPFRGQSAFQHVETWNLAVEGYELDMPRLLSVDVEESTFFTRSADSICMGCTTVAPVNSVFAYQAKSSQIEAICKYNSN